MKTENINKKYLDKVLAGDVVDYMYHLGLASNDDCLNKMKDVKAVVLAGSAHRVSRMAQTWHNKHSEGIFFKFPKDERFTIFYTNGVIFSSHGMGMPSMSIALQELMKLVYFLKNGDLEQVNKVFWARVGTSGGLVEPGTVVVSTEALCSDFKPYKLSVLAKEFSFETVFPSKTVKDIIKLNSAETFPIIEGKTIGGDCFYLEQNRIDGAIALCNESEKLEWLRKAYELGVRNIEMESPVTAAFLNHWGFSNFAVICCVLLNRLKGDQISSSKKELESYSLRAEKVLWNYLDSLI
jgi:uridine phosphorylase